ncbi:MAG: hypothetical protein M1838_005349 [Thelocarpon superellum]|nr:MAG: hypothetical protein M1838_005349 [Thelocarpon superellum]
MTASKREGGALNVDAYISDDSSFYGDEELRSYLEEQSAEFDPLEWWAHQKPSIQTGAPSSVQRGTGSDKSHLYNPYADQIQGRQLSESVAAFLGRAPPSSTSVEEYGPWIFIANPHASRRPLDEDLAGLARTGQELLDAFMTEKTQIEEQLRGRPEAVIKRAVTKARKPVEEALLHAATEKRCTSGKWMLFPSPGIVDHVWGLIAKSTAANELGIAAKVATKPAGDDRASRLICIYTADFADQHDVRRVLHKLVELGAVDRSAAIYYKCDTFTHLGINSRNPYGFKASMYASKELLARGA